jgi:hypothetical protein
MDRPSAVPSGPLRSVGSLGLEVVKGAPTGDELQALLIAVTAKLAAAQAQTGPDGGSRWWRPERAAGFSAASSWQANHDRQPAWSGRRSA